MKSRHRVVVPALITSVVAAATAHAQQRLDLSAVFDESVVDEVPERISCPTLEYPRELQAADVQGSVLVRFVVATMGHVETSSVEVLSSTHEGFVHFPVSCHFPVHSTTNGMPQLVVRHAVRCCE